MFGVLLPFLVLSSNSVFVSGALPVESLLEVCCLVVSFSGLRSLKFIGPRLWNSLPSSSTSTNSNSLRIFRKTLKDSMLNCYSN